MKVSFIHSLEILIPAEIDLDIDAEFTPGSDGYFDYRTGDAEPPSNDEAELNNEDAVEKQIRQWFADQCQETLKQWHRFVGSNDFKDLVRGKIWQD